MSRKNDRELDSVFEETESIMLLAMNMLSKDHSSVIPEMMYTLDSKTLFKFVTLFGGKTIYIPKPEELTFYMNCVLCAYFYKVQKASWPNIQKALKVEDDEEMTKIRRYVKSYLGTLTKHEYGLLNSMNKNGKVMGKNVRRRPRE